MTIRFSSDGRTWSEVATFDPPDVPGIIGGTSLSGAVSLIAAEGRASGPSGSVSS
jgi:hypothetical protein